MYAPIGRTCAPPRYVSPTHSWRRARARGHRGERRRCPDATRSSDPGRLSSEEASDWRCRSFAAVGHGRVSPRLCAENGHPAGGRRQATIFSLPDLSALPLVVLSVAREIVEASELRSTTGRRRTCVRSWMPSMTCSLNSSRCTHRSRRRRFLDGPRSEHRREGGGTRSQGHSACRTRRRGPGPQRLVLRLQAARHVADPGDESDRRVVDHATTRRCSTRISCRSPADRVLGS